MSKRYISPQNGPVDVKTDKDSHSRSQEQETPKEIVVGAYTPTESEVKEAYQRGEFVNKAMSEQRWQRWLHKVKAYAWEEGVEAVEAYGMSIANYEQDEELLVNPYESEES